MYVQSRMGKKGDVVIPAFIRKNLKMEAGEEILILQRENIIEIIPKDKSAIKRMRERAAKAGLKEEDLVMGDALYEEVFG